MSWKSMMELKIVCGMVFLYNLSGLYMSEKSIPDTMHFDLKRRLGRSQATAHRFTITVGNDHRASQKVNLTLPSQQPIYPRLSQTIGISAISRFSIDGKICTVKSPTTCDFPDISL